MGSPTAAITAAITGGVTGGITGGITVAVVDNDPFTRATLAEALRGLGCTIVGPFASARECLTSESMRPAPQVAVLDLDLGTGPTGIDLAHALRERDPEIGIVLLTHYTDPRLFSTSLPRLPRGAHYVSKHDLEDLAPLHRAIAAAGRSPLDPAPGTSVPPGPTADLTATQIEVLRAVAEGFTTAEIARQREVSAKAVEKVITRICDQLDLPRTASMNQRVQMVRAYYRMTRPADG